MKILRLLIAVFLVPAALAVNTKLVSPHHDANNTKGDEAFARKDWATAVACYTEALKNVPYLPTYINRATAYIGLGKYDEAIADYDQAILMNNDKINSDIRLREIIYNRALAYTGSKQYEKAIADFTYIITRSEHSVLPFLGRGNCQLELGRLKEARHDTQVALKLNPDSVRANLQMLRVDLKSGDTAATHQQLAKLVVLADHSSNATAYNGLAWYLASAASDELRDGARAVLYATKACELTKWQDASCVDTLAVACASAGDFPNAIKWEKDYLNRTGPTEAQKHAAQSRLEAFQHSRPYRESN